MIGDATFSPAFTYPIFGEAETILGHRNLRIKLEFAPGSLQTYLSVSSKPSKDADDIEGKLYEFLPADYLKDAATFKQRCAEPFTPLGTRIGSFKGKERAYEAYHTTMATPGFRE